MGGINRIIEKEEKMNEEKHFSSSDIDHKIHSFWSVSPSELYEKLNITEGGLTASEAKSRLLSYGANRLKPPARSGVFTLFIAQFKSPIILILLFATGLSFFLHDPADAAIILAIVIISGLLGFWQEYSATDAVKKLLAIVQIKATVIRDGKQQEIHIEDIVPGDIIVLNAGDIVPGDCRILESKDIFVDESMPLTLVFQLTAALMLPKMHPILFYLKRT